MSVFHDRTELASGTNGGAVTAEFDLKSLPELCGALRGEWDAEKRAWKHRPATLSVWIEGPYVKVCLSSGDATGKWFWSTDSMEALTEQVEAALGASLGNWWYPSVQKRR